MEKLPKMLSAVRLNTRSGRLEYISPVSFSYIMLLVVM
jgi:hypothetical protein